jgi:hypothetical protein
MLINNCTYVSTKKYEKEIAVGFQTLKKLNNTDKCVVRGAGRYGT